MVFVIFCLTSWPPMSFFCHKPLLYQILPKYIGEASLINLNRKRPTGIFFAIRGDMKRLLPCILLFFAVLSGSAQASELVKVARIDTGDVAQFYFSFDKTPEFKSFRSERRIDLEFYGTTCAPSVSLGKADQNIVKILPRPAKDRYILSLFFRYRPQHYKLTRSIDGKLVFEVLLGNKYSKSYQDLAEQLKGLTTLNRNAGESTNPYLSSPYAKNWLLFFSQYESPVQLEIPISFSLPPFPLIALLPPAGKDNLRLIDSQMSELAEQKLWGELAGKVLRAIENRQDEQDKKLLALTYGEVLSRAGKFDEAFRQLYLLKDTYSDELLGTYANYLLYQLRAVHENPYIADVGYRSLESSIGNSLPLAPYLLLSQIETAIATKDHQRLNHLLQRDDVAFPQLVAEKIQIHQADYWYAIHQQIKAQAAYRLLADSSLLQTLPYSLGGYCNGLYSQKQFTEAATCYQKLSTLVTGEELTALIDYKKDMAKLHTMKEGTELIDEFANIAKLLPHSEAGFRSELKRNDLLFLQNKTWGLQAIENYAAIAKEATSRSIREEAIFKQALVQAILGDAGASIDLLHNFLREFLTGDVRISAQALLIDLLPKQIKRLVDNHQYLQPLILAKQNKLLFQNQWIDSRFLAEIAEAYSRIGIYDEAQKLYLYLIGIMPVDQKEDYFPPMIKAAYDNGNFSLVDDYSAQYDYTYPQGRYSSEIFLLRLHALVADDRLSDALLLLPDPLPENDDLYHLSIAVFFRTDHYRNCLESAKKLIAMGSDLSAIEQYMYAESLYVTGNFDDSEQAFLKVGKENDFYEQSLYRLAELARKKGKEKKALSFFQKIVETEKNSLWKEFAERELQFTKTAARN